MYIFGKATDLHPQSEIRRDWHIEQTPILEPGLQHSLSRHHMHLRLADHHEPRHQVAQVPAMDRGGELVARVEPRQAFIAEESAGLRQWRHAEPVLGIDSALDTDRVC